LRLPNSPSSSFGTTSKDCSLDVAWPAGRRRRMAAFFRAAAPQSPLQGGALRFGPSWAAGLTLFPPLRTDSLLPLVKLVRIRGSAAYRCVLTGGTFRKLQGAVRGSATRGDAERRPVVASSFGFLHQSRRPHAAYASHRARVSSAPPSRLLGHREHVPGFRHVHDELAGVCSQRSPCDHCPRPKSRRGVAGSLPNGGCPAE
jgi:hypothetical protein